MELTVRPSQSISSSTLAPSPLLRRQILVYWPDYDSSEIRELLVFGPNYTTEGEGFWEQEKKEALRHVLRNSRCSYEDLRNEIGSVEEEAKAAYPVGTLSNMSRDFRDIMAEDGCFFLLLAFSILGAGPELKFPDNHLLFGIGRVAEHLTCWLRSIFLVGNQVPLTVLEKLMNYLSFFRELKARRNQWNNLLSDDHELYKRTIHKFVMSKAGQEDDIIHCLQSVMLGKSTTTVSEMHQGIKEEGHQYSIVIPSALLLSEKGIHFEKLEGELGVRSIDYKPCKLFNNPVLYLPCFSVDKHTELMVECLLKYENVQSWTAKMEPEASSYFMLLKELIPTTQDLGILYSSGIIRGKPDGLHRLLLEFPFTGTSAHLCRIRQQIKEDTDHSLLPWRKLRKGVCAVSTFLVLLFTYLQAHYTILSYYRNPH